MPCRSPATWLPLSVVDVRSRAGQADQDQQHCGPMNRPGKAGDSGLGLAAQEATIRGACRARRLQLLWGYQDVASGGSGGSLDGMSELAEALGMARGVG